jgi:hypothetical protein
MANACSRVVLLVYITCGVTVGRRNHNIFCVPREVGHGFDHRPQAQDQTNTCRIYM